MKFNKKIAALVLGGIVALGGVGVASAFIISSATPQSGKGAGDSAVVLNFDDATDVNIASVVEPSYQTLKVELNHSTSVTGTATASFTLAQGSLSDDETGKTLGDVKVTISQQTFDVAAGGTHDSSNDIVLVTNGTLTGNFTYDITLYTEDDLYLKFESATNAAENLVFHATLTATLTFAESSVSD